MREKSEELALLSAELGKLRCGVRALRRYVEDILYNLEEENMPRVAERLNSLSEGLSLLLTAGKSPAIDAEALTAALNGRTAPLSLDRACAPTLYKNATAKTDALRLLAIAADGTLHAVI